MTKREIAALKSRRTRARTQLLLAEGKLRELGAVLSEFGRRMYDDDIYGCSAEISEINRRLWAEGVK